MRQSQYLSSLYRPPLEKKDNEEKIYLDKNEPPFSAFETLDGVLNNMDMKQLRVYPNLYSLYEKLALFSEVKIENLLLSQGSEQAIKSIFEVFVEAGDKVVYFQPSFAMYDVFSYQKKAKVLHLNFNDDGSMSVDKILQTIDSKTRLFVLINPHNFTGTSLTFDELESIARHTLDTGTIFLLDEAYYHYYTLESVDLIEKYPNIIITRTFSKALGIAGARVGYAIASKDNVELLRKVKPIDEIDYLAGIVAEKVLDSAQKISHKNILQVQKWQKVFSKAAIEGIEYLETNANFILLRSSKYKIHRDVLLHNKIIPKYDFQDKCLKNCIRFSVTNDEIMQNILNLLRGDKQ